MITHYITLKHFSSWLQQTIAGKRICAVYSQNADELMVEFEGNEPSALRISIAPQENFIYYTSRSARAKRNTIDLLTSIVDSKVVSVSSFPYDRIVQVFCDNELSLRIHLFGSGANILIIDKDGMIFDAYKNIKILAGTQLLMEEHLKAEPFPADYDGFRKFIAQHSGEPLRDTIRRWNPYFGSPLLNEIFFRGGISGDTINQASNDEQYEIFYRAMKSVFEDLEHPTPCIYYDGSKPVRMSVIQLLSSTNFREVRFENVNDAIRTYISHTQKADHFEDAKSNFLSRIKKELDRCRRAVEKIKKEIDTDSRADQYEHYGGLLMTFAPSLARGLEEAVVNEPASGKEVRIECDPSLSPVQNAENYYLKAWKARASLKESQERFTEFKERIARLKKMQEALEGCKTDDEVDKIIQDQSSLLKILGMTEEGKEEVKIPFRVFWVVGGFEVWAGKSNENNDELTFKYAKQNDLWFHARGASGSHVILRIGTGIGDPSKEAKEATAAIAAYYSKQRNAKYVPVAMTERKFVRKPKGSPPGTVAIDREKVMVVTPKLPEGSKED